MLRPLPAGDVAQAVAHVMGQSADDPDIQAAAGASGGSVARALMLLDGPALELRQRIVGLLEKLPQVDQRALHQLGDKLAGVDAGPLLAFMEAVNGWLSAELDRSPRDPRRMARLAQVWDEINTAGRDTETYNLDRRPLVFSVFGALAAAARG
jgi:DNA polymerase-3 subunit delta'